MITRRQFFKLGLAAGASLALPAKFFTDFAPVYASTQSDKLRKFIQPLRGVGGNGIPVAVPDAVRQPWWQKGVTHYTIEVGQFEDQLHPDLPNATRLWGYGQNGSFKHLGGIIAAKRGEPVQITFRNNLPPDHILPVDETVMGVMGNQMNRTNPHLHGGFVPWISDGGPQAWWDPNGNHGPSYKNDFLHPGLAANEGELYYPNNQSARLMWYHDHTFGLTRLNAYAGVATGYVIYDDYELQLVAQHHLPGPLDPRTVYLVFQDKVFVSNTIDQDDPDWTSLITNTRPGDLWYEHHYNDADLQDPPPPTLPSVPSCVPEFFGDTMLVNGQAYPVLEVEPRQYRFRMLNACQARFLNPRLVYAQNSNKTEPGTKAGPAFIQIGTEGGFLPYPTFVAGPNLPELLLAPAERADLIVDFRDVLPGSVLLLYSDAPAPYPMGDPAVDFYPGNPETPSSIPGYGPNTRTLMMIKVTPRKGQRDEPITLPMMFEPTDPFLIGQKPGTPAQTPKGVNVRYLTLNESFDELGRLLQRLGTTEALPNAMPGDFGRAYLDGPTEVVHAGSTEVWEIANLTGDTHPIHFHLVNVQVLSRQGFDPTTYTGGVPQYTTGLIAPDTNELGWKETVRMSPNQVTRVLIKFNLPAVPFKVPLSKTTGVTGHEYVWHCHILEHEEHDMMRPLIVK